MAAGAARVFPQAEVGCCPVGDGGEGTLDALLASVGGRTEERPVCGPLGEQRTARLGLLADGETAYVELAEASGLSGLPAGRRDPLASSSFGTGELLAAAYAAGRRRILVGLGGSATNDGGSGLLVALGARFLDVGGEPLPPGGAALERLERIDVSGLRRPPPGTKLVIVGDVTNPLCGPEGASAVYGPQKGASAADVARLDGALARFAGVAAAALGRDLRDSPGAGAAGGAGFALLAFLDAQMERGAGLVLDTVRIDARLAGADLALTGEGRIDRQTFAYGKTLAVLGERCRAAGVPCIAFAGGLSDDLGDHAAAGVGAVAGIVPRPMPLEEAMRAAPALISAAVERSLRLTVLGEGVRR
jgi:glycerate kinase